MRSAVFTKVGTYVVSSAEDDTVKVWDLKYMKAPTTIIRQRIGVNRYACVCVPGIQPARPPGGPSAAARNDGPACRAGPNGHRWGLVLSCVGRHRLAVSPTVATIAAPCDNGDIVLTDLSGGIVANIARSPTVPAPSR